jgi:hypothetical protein
MQRPAPAVHFGRTVAVVVVLGLCVLPRLASAQISIASTADHVSLASWNGNLTNVNLLGRTNYFGEWRWMYFKINGVQGAAPTFTITQNFAGDGTPGLHELQEQEFVYSYDNEHWSFFDNNALLAQNTDKFRFSNSTPFTQNSVYIAYAIPIRTGGASRTHRRCWHRRGPSRRRLPTRAA